MKQVRRIYLNFGFKGIGIEFDSICVSGDLLLHFYLADNYVFTLTEDEIKHKLKVDHDRFIKDKIYYVLKMI